MTGFLLKIAGYSASLYLVSLYVDGFTFDGSIVMLAWAGLWITVGSYVKAILKIIAFPITFISLGVFSIILDFIVSAGILWVLGAMMEPLVIESITALIWGAVFIGIINSIISFFVKLIW